MPHEDVSAARDKVDDQSDGARGQGDGTARDGSEDLPDPDANERSREV
jgi:hypothetical protein